MEWLPACESPADRSKLILERWLGNRGGDRGSVTTRLRSEWIGLSSRKSDRETWTPEEGLVAVESGRRGDSPPGRACVSLEHQNCAGRRELPGGGFRDDPFPRGRIPADRSPPGARRPSAWTSDGRVPLHEAVQITRHGGTPDVLHDLLVAEPVLLRVVE